MGRDEKSVQIMYGEEDLSLFPAFQGGFINFGYWKTLPDRLTVADRVKSSAALYEKVFDVLGSATGGEVLEVGCGRGLGCRVLEEKRRPRRLVGLDATPEQIQRAEAGRAPGSAIVFQQGEAEALPFPDGSFDAIYSVEAAQHFPSLSPFFRESTRCLRPGGRLVVTTFFATNVKHQPALAAAIPTIAKGIDRATPVDEVVKRMGEAGLGQVKCESIGDKVWEGLDRWLAQTPEKDGWGRNWLKAYRSGWLDYYVLSAEKP